MDADRDAYRWVAPRDEHVALARREILGAREHARDAGGRRAREHRVEVISEAAVVKMRVCVDRVRAGQAVFARSTRGKSDGAERIGFPGCSRPQRATASHFAVAGDSTPSTSAIRGLIVGMY